MLANRSMPGTTVIPELAYRDVTGAADWLCKAFGFTVRIAMGRHRAQLNVPPGGAVVLTSRPSAVAADRTHSTMVRVENVDGLFEQATRAGAKVLGPPTTQPYGERQCTLEDPGGHVWTFSQSVADRNPEDWGGTVGVL